MKRHRRTNTRAERQAAAAESHRITHKLPKFIYPGQNTEASLTISGIIRKKMRRIAPSIKLWGRNPFRRRD